MRRALASILLLVCSSFAVADVESGPKAGAAVAPLKVFAITGAIEGKEVDYAKERKDEPTVYFFVNAEKFSRPMNKFMLAIDGKLADASDKAMSVIVWTGGDFEKNKEYMPKLQKAVSYSKSALTVFDGDANGPKDWGLNSAAHLTVVVTNAGKVVKSFAYESVNETDAKDVIEALKKATEKK
jgi:hypothetical protein